VAPVLLPVMLSTRPLAVNALRRSYPRGPSRALYGAELLIGGRLTHEEALRQYFPRPLDAYKGDRSRVFSFDGIGAAYV
jgi:hypothetical protein